MGQQGDAENNWLCPKSREPLPPAGLDPAPSPAGTTIIPSHIPRQGSWNWILFQVPSKPIHSTILGSLHRPTRGEVRPGRRGCNPRGLPTAPNPFISGSRSFGATSASLAGGITLLLKQQDRAARGSDSTGLPPRKKQSCDQTRRCSPPSRRVRSSRLPAFSSFATPRVNLGASSSLPPSLPPLLSPSRRSPPPASTSLFQVPRSF